MLGFKNYEVMMDKIACIRGATTLKTNTKDEIFSKTQELVSQILLQNKLSVDMIASCIIGSSMDINEAYPASAITSSGQLRGVPLFSTLEPDIKGGLPLCIRVLMTVMCAHDFSAHHVYLGKASELKTNTN